MITLCIGAALYILYIGIRLYQMVKGDQDTCNH